MILNKKYIRWFSFFALFLICSCAKRPLPPSIGNQMSFPGFLATLDSSHFLLLNTVASGDYSDGSIQLYNVDTSGNYNLQNVLSIPVHGTELAVSPDRKLVALSFDSSYSTTQVQFYNYTDINHPSLLSNLTLNSFTSAGGQQAVKRIGIFQRPGDANYYFYGSILSYPLSDGRNGDIPSRVFLAKVASDFSSSQMLFTLSYGVGDPNSLSYQSSAWNKFDPNSTQYTFGFTAPTYDATHDLFIAFPTGTIGGYSNSTINFYPGLPDPLTYFSGQPNGNVISCNGSPCIQTDYRAVSLAAVDMSRIVAGDPINNSTYFVPLGFNGNGVPYAAVSNGANIIYPYNSNNTDISSFSFESNYWTSYWAGSKNLGTMNDSACYPAGVTTISGASNTTAKEINQYTLAGDNGVFVVKNGQNNDNGNGNEVFQVTGLDLLSNNIKEIESSRGNINPAGENDFSQISNVQIIDPYNKYVSSINTNWLNGSSGTKNAGPLTIYMYSRTTNIDVLGSYLTAVGNISIVNTGATCLPYWMRNTYNSINASIGMDSSWLTANNIPLSPGQNGTYPDASVDPTQPTIYSYPIGAGAEVCTDVSPANTPIVFCANFLTSNISRFQVTAGGSVFNSF